MLTTFCPDLLASKMGLVNICRRRRAGRAIMLRASAVSGLSSKKKQHDGFPTHCKVDRVAIVSKERESLTQNL
jgi:hypothetical protein